MGKVATTFLTFKNFSEKKILDNLKNFKTNDKTDQEILNQIIIDFENNDFSLLTPQQIQFFKNRDSEKWAPYLIFRYKFTNYPKNHIDSEIPNHLIIEPVSACNLRCVMCFQVDETFTSDQNFMGQMDFEFFKKIIDDAHKSGIQAITLTGRGEPTLHPKISDMLDYCSGKFFEIKMNTNATRLTKELSHKILQSGITDLVFSVDSYEKKEYETIRVRGIFEEIFKNIKRFKEIKETYPNSICATRISGVKINKKQNPEKFKAFWQEYVDHVVMVELLERWDIYNNSTEKMSNGICNYLWGEMNIWYDGICNPCDTDYKSELAVGTIKEKSIKEIWNGEKYRNLRNAHKNKKRNTCQHCDRCPNW
jgi:radical SAM protein with 4Fe4S-binding SPASM domain